jgi:hypothetical protein
VHNATIANLNVTQSNVGEVEVSAIKDLINIVFGVGIPIVNGKWLKDGIPLPQVPYVEFSNSELAMEDGYLLVSATPKYDFKGLLELIKETDPNKYFNIYIDSLDDGNKDKGNGKSDEMILAMI